MDFAPSPEVAAVDVALVEWRRKAANILLAASAAAFLPSSILFLLGYGPPIRSLAVRSVVLVTYLVMTAAALFRRIEYRRRLFAYFVAAYVVVAYANLAHRGSIAEIGLVATPILVLVLCGSAAARIAILTSFTVLVSTPFLRNLPGLAQALGAGPTQADPPDLAWFHAAVIAGFLVTQSGDRPMAKPGWPSVGPRSDGWFEVNRAGDLRESVSSPHGTSVLE